MKKKLQTALLAATQNLLHWTEEYYQLMDNRRSLESGIFDLCRQTGDPKCLDGEIALSKKGYKASEKRYRKLLDKANRADPTIAAANRKRAGAARKAFAACVPVQ